jgi:cystathionine beta-lyase
MLGTASANAKYWPQLREHSYLMGYCAAADDVYLAARGLRTLGVRLAQHQRNVEPIVAWLLQQPEVATVLHPALPEHPGHAAFLRDFSGGNGLFSFVLKAGDANTVQAFVEGMQHFKMGFSWGGYESLVVANLDVQALRTATVWPHQGPLIRLHIGLEDPQDLLADLAAAFTRIRALV